MKKKFWKKSFLVNIPLMVFLASCSKSGSILPNQATTQTKPIITVVASNLNVPQGVTLDANGNIYFTEFYYSRVRKIDVNGSISTFAGNDKFGFADGIGTAASFNSPFGIVANPSGILYVTDVGNNFIRKITSAGSVSTIAGEFYGYSNTFAENGKGLQTSFYGPTGITLDGSGNLFVSDSQNHLIRKITPDTTVTTFAGKYGSYGADDGIGVTATFVDPIGLAVDAAGNIYVADAGSSSIRKITPSGVVTTIAGGKSVGSSDGKGSAASFQNPNGVTVDSSGNIYVADTGNGLIRKITADGTVTTFIAKGLIVQPTAITIDNAGNLYVIDESNNAICKISEK